MMVCVPKCKNDFGEFYGFETLTMAPFDRDLILTGDMTENEIRAVDEYHKKVYESISGLLDEETAKWLAEVTKPLGKN